MDNNMTFTNQLVNKRQLKQLMYNVFLNYGIIKSSVIADRVKNLTFHYATQSGISLSIEDLRVPSQKLELIGLTTSEVEIVRKKNEVGKITDTERFQRTIDIWNNANNFLKDEVLTYFRDSDPLNPLYIMAFSGARGNISQVRQLVGMRGLMADPQGQIIDLPIRSNFREGLTVTEYIISSYGARKGLIDTALRTADSGYLTRRLVDVAQDIIIREEDCGTHEGLSEVELAAGQPLDKTRLLGRLLSKALISDNQQILAPANFEITPTFIEKLTRTPYKPQNLIVRSPLTCKSIRGVCRKCYGWHLSYSRMVDLGEAVGIIAAQSIGEPGTQLTMRTFHTGGVFSGDLTYQIRAPYRGVISYQVKGQAFLFRTLHGELGFRTNNAIDLTLLSPDNTQISYKVPIGGVILVNANQKVYRNEIIAEIRKEADVVLEEEQTSIITQESGVLHFHEATTGRLSKTDAKTPQVKVNSPTLLWILNGTISSLPDFMDLNVKPGTFLNRRTVIAQDYIKNTYSGLASFEQCGDEEIITICHSKLTLNKLIGKRMDNGKYQFQLLNRANPFNITLEQQPDTTLQKGDIIATIDETNYRTEVGGIITYSLDNISGKKKKSLRNIFSGLIYWIPEETHSLEDSDLEWLQTFQRSRMVVSGTEVLPGIFSKVGGFVHIDELNHELVIKPGELFNVSTLEQTHISKTNRFVKPGQEIIPDRLIAQHLVYLEFFNIFDDSYLLIRPVTTYAISKEKAFNLQHLAIPAKTNRLVQIKAIKRIFFKNWERVRSSTSVDLVKTYLIVDFAANSARLQPKLRILPSKDANNNSYTLQIDLCEIIKFKNKELKHIDPRLSLRTTRLISKKQYLYANTTLASREVLFQKAGILGSQLSEKNEFLILEKKTY